VNYRAFLNRICDDGIEEVARAYTDANKIDGARAGFEEARQTLDAHDLKAVLAAAKADTIKARDYDAERYWWYRIRELQIEWVANVVSASLYNNGQPVIVQPTMRGWNKAADILGRTR
jgi:hypothetical protein